MKNIEMTKGKENKPHIGIFGKRNAGKSSLINCLCGQEVSIVSDIAGTTTDPVKKSVEITGFGPVIIIDTAGIDDTGKLGEKRIEKTLHSIESIDLAILVITNNSIDNDEQKLITLFNSKNLPFFIIHNKSDLNRLTKEFVNYVENEFKVPILDFSSVLKLSTDDIVNTIKNIIPDLSWRNTSLLGDVLQRGDIVLLITPIDESAPEGRLILPQVQTIRDLLDNNCVSVVMKEEEIENFLQKTQIKPALVITDSQIFHNVAKKISRDIPLTGFSVVLARHKGDFENYMKGTPEISNLKNGDRVLILESCTHHVSCDDIGRVKIPNLMRKFTGKQLEFDVVVGLDKLQRNILDYALVVQCGGCVITRKQVINRLRPAIEAGIPVTNYGMAIAWMHGIYQRAIEIFKSDDK